MDERILQKIRHRGERRKLECRKIEKMMNKNKNKNKNVDSGGNNGNFDISSSSSSCSILGDDIMIEILSRLPGKSLMRFKCVCKRWQFLIQRDDKFHGLHLTHSKTRLPNLLIVLSLINEYESLGNMYKDCYLTLDLLFHQGSAAAGFLQTIMMTNWFYFEILKPVNGLICLVDYEVLGVRIYNHCTREVTPWIRPTILSRKEKEEHCGQHPITCGFGYDPATKEYKVICMWRILGMFRFSSDEREVCKVLTVGDNSWRSVADVPPPGQNLKGTPVYVNGSIYWRNFINLYDKSASLVAFDVGREKFRVIPIPVCILKRARRSHALFSPHLLEIDGRVTISHRINDTIVDLYIFDDDDDEYNKENNNSNSNWIEETITLPSYWNKSKAPYFLDIAGTNQLIVETCGDSYKSFYSYDRKRKTFNKCEVNGIPNNSIIPWRDHCGTPLFTTFVESLLPGQQPPPPYHTRPLP